MCVLADAQHRQIDGSFGNRAIQSRTRGIGVGARADFDEMVAAEACWIDQVRAEHGAKTGGMAVREADVLVELEHLHA